MNRRRFFQRTIPGLAILPRALKPGCDPLVASGTAASKRKFALTTNRWVQSTSAPSPHHPPVPQMEPRLPRIENIWYEEPVPVGLSKQLLVDEYLISHRFNMQRELNSATKANDGKPLLALDKPWEHPYYMQVKSVFREGDRFRMWYWGRDGFTAYAESEDGFTWKKPNLELHEFQGSKNNNLTDLCEACYPDPHELDPAHKYKAPFGHPKSPRDSGVSLAHSSDGYRWTLYNNGDPVTYRATDTLNQILWDEDAQVYRLFTRTDFGTGGGDTEYRGAREMVNPDVKANPTNWTTVQSWKFDREGPTEVLRRQVHTLNVWIYEGVHFALLSVYEWPAAGFLVKVKDYQRRQERDVWNFYISARRPGYSMDWDHRWVYEEKPLIARGLEGSFDKDIIHASSTVVTWKDQHWIYYSGWPVGHFRLAAEPPEERPGAIGLATFPLDRIVFWEPWLKADAGWLISKPFRLEGSHLELNAEAKRGWVSVEVLNLMGEPFPGFSLKQSKLLEATDGLRLQAQWDKQADLASLRGSLVRLKFHLKNARLYTFQVKS